MGKRAREKKLTKEELRTHEKDLVLQRKRDRLEPTMRLLKKFILTFLITLFLLWVGFFVTNNLGLFLSSLGGWS